MRNKKLTFENRQGTALSAILDFPVDGKPAAFALFAHCFTCTKHIKAAHHISRALSREGIAVLRFDFTGLGESRGDFADTSFSSNVDDLVAAADFLKREYLPPKILIGHSLGGAAVLKAAAQIPSATAVATIAAPANPDHVMRHIGDAEDRIKKEGEAEVNLGGRPFRIKKEFIEDIRQVSMADAIRDLGKALIVFHSPVDTVVGIDNAAEIFKMAKHPKSFVTLDQADHLLADPRDSRYVGAVIAAWARKYIELPEPAADDDQKDSRVIARIGRSHYRTEIRADGQSLIADEPESVGGTGLGPSPYDFLVAGLGACTAMTLRMYADRKEWPLESATVRLKHRKIHAGDCRDCETTQGKLDEIEREIEVEGDLDDDQKQRLLEIADRCPVHRTLHGEIKVRTKLRE